MHNITEITQRDMDYFKEEVELDRRLHEMFAEGKRIYEERKESDDSKPVLYEFDDDDDTSVKSSEEYRNEAIQLGEDISKGKLVVFDDFMLFDLRTHYPVELRDNALEALKKELPQDEYEIKKALSQGLDINNVRERAKDYALDVYDGILHISDEVDQYPLNKLYEYFKDRILNEECRTVSVQYSIRSKRDGHCSQPGGLFYKTGADYKYFCLMIDALNNYIRCREHQGYTIIQRYAWICVRYYIQLFNPYIDGRKQKLDLVLAYQKYNGCRGVIEANMGW